MASDSHNDKEWNRQIEYMAKIIEEEQEKNNEIKVLQLSYGNYVLLDDYVKLQKENQQLKEKLNCKEYFSSTMPEDTEFVILTKNNYDRQQKDLALENIQLKKQKDDVVEFLKYSLYTYCQEDAELYEETRIKILRMLGEIDVED